ncbi:MAG: hypothetical protein KQH63_11140 [Desulfobulbaceae bacterium]|nr:hypothetical protein [Desulfobulbaceae bacterium]
MKKNKSFTIGIGETLLCIFIPSLLFAADPVPSTVDPGRIEKRFEQPIQPKSVLEPVIPKMEGEGPPPEAEKVKFILSGINISGSTVYKDADLSLLYEEYLNREISLSVVYEIAAAITAKYGNDGYVLSRAFVPPQRIQNGIVQITIIEGFIDKVIIDGDHLDSRGFFEDYRTLILASKPLDNKILERCLLLANDLAGLTVKSILKPSEDVPGASSLILTIETKNINGSVSIDDRGTKSTGPFQNNWSVGENSFFRPYESTSVSYIMAGGPSWDELSYYSFNHEEALTSSGLKLTLSGNYSRSKPGTEELEAIELKSKNTTLAAHLSYPFIRSRQQNLTATSRFTYRNSKSRILGDISSEDRLRILTLGINYDYADQYRGINQLVIEFSQGLGILNHTRNGNPYKTRADGHSDFSKITVQASRTQELPKNYSLYSALMMQGAATPLLSSEEAGFGGEQFGRAYDSSEITGDHLLAASVELRYLPQMEIPRVSYLQLYGFFDIGAVYEISPDPGIPEEKNASSAGFGLRFGLTEYISGSLEIAKPLTRPVTDEGDDGYDFRSFFRLTARI